MNMNAFVGAPGRGKGKVNFFLNAEGQGEGENTGVQVYKRR